MTLKFQDNKEKLIIKQEKLKIGRGEQESTSDVEVIKSNVNALAGSIVWLEELIRKRMAELKGGERFDMKKFAETIDNTFLKETTAFYQLLHEYSNSYVEYLMISLAFTAWFRPRSLAGLVVKKEESDEIYAEAGILGNGTNSRYIPTLQTVLFFIGWHRSCETSLLS